jgi:hypothetical protein
MKEHDDILPNESLETNLVEGVVPLSAVNHMFKFNFNFDNYKKSLS